MIDLYRGQYNDDDDDDGAARLDISKNTPKHGIEK